MRAELGMSGRKVLRQSSSPSLIVVVCSPRDDIIMTHTTATSNPLLISRGVPLFGVSWLRSLAGLLFTAIREGCRGCRLGRAVSKVSRRES
jgi:hypothetical protein